MMKKLLIAPALALFLFSCSDSDECHECHVAYMTDAGEVEVEIGEFCGSNLEEVEAPDYLHTIEETVVGTDTVPAGSYEVHCEEHGDHDH
jgi:hypothetical protein